MLTRKQPGVGVGKWRHANVWHGGFSAFTLVELLVVIGIIAVLVAILLPSLNRARASAQVVNCLSNVRQIAMVSVMYANDNHGYLPRYTDSIPAGNDPRTNLPHARKWSWNWTGLLFRYLGNNTRIYQCPGGTWKNDTTSGSGVFVPMPGSRGYGPIKVGYQVNGVVGGAVTGSYGSRMSRPYGPVFASGDGGTTWNDTQGTMRISAVANDTIMVADSVRGDQEQSSTLFRNDGVGAFAGIRNLSVTSHSNRFANIAYADGRGETIQAGSIAKEPRYMFEQVITAATPNAANDGSLGDLKIRFNNTNLPRGFWTAARDD